MELKVKIYLTDDEGVKFMGIGVIWLLEEIERAGSLRKAAMNLGISYTKSYAMLSRAEENLSFPLVERRRGGSSHEGAVLTEQAKEFIKLYRAFQSKAKERVAKEYEDFVASLSCLHKENDDGQI